MFKIFLDDIREASANCGYNVTRSYKDCIILLDLFKYSLERVDLDYDLGTLNETGLDVLIYMKEHGINPRYINIHSDHPEGSREMVKYANENFKESIVTQTMIT